MNFEGTLRAAGRRPWVLLAPVLVACACVLLISGRGLSFSTDDFSYYSRSVIFSGFRVSHFDSVTLEYLFTPHNGHLQVAGKLVYELLLALFGANYVAFRIVAVAGVLLCIALFFDLARRRVGPGVALLLAIWLAFFGAAWEVLLWPFDMHTTLSMAAGLAAYRALVVGGRHADLVAFLFLLVSLAFIELGLVFVLAAAIHVLSREDRWRRSWIYLVPAVLYACWYIWAQKYGFQGSQGSLWTQSKSVVHSLGSTIAALIGAIPTGPQTSVYVVGQPVIGTVLAIAVILGLVAAAVARRLPIRALPMIAAVFAYWGLIALGGRPPDSSRYMFAGALLLLLAATELVGRRRLAPLAVAALTGLIVIAVPTNLAKLGDGATTLRDDADLTRGEFAMFKLAGDRGDPDYLSIADPDAQAVGASPYIVMSTGRYLDSARAHGPLDDSLARIRGESVNLRRVDDVVLAGALGLQLIPLSEAPRHPQDCVRSPTAAGVLELPDAGAIVHAVGTHVSELGLGRFETEGPARRLGVVKPGSWASLAIPGEDNAGVPWRLFFDAPVEVCALD